MWSGLTGWFTGMLEYLVPFLFKKKGTLLFLGLDEAGKSTLMYRLKFGRMGAVLPTAKPTSESMQCGNVTFTAYDMGGHKQARRLWKDYYVAAHGVIFVIDGANRRRFDEAKDELQKLLSDEEIKDVPVAVLVNKIDLADCADVHEIITHFGLYDLVTGKELKPSLEGKRPLSVFPVSILCSQGYGEALRWMAAQIS